MTDLERELRQLFESRAAAATPIDALDDVVAGTTPLALDADRDRGGSRWLAVAAAAVVLAVAVVALSRRFDDQSPVSPTIDFPVDAPTAPLVDTGRAASIERS